MREREPPTARPGRGAASGDLELDSGASVGGSYEDTAYGRVTGDRLQGTGDRGRRECVEPGCVRLAGGSPASVRVQPASQRRDPGRYETDTWGNVLSGLVAEEGAIYGGGLGYWYDPDLALYYVKARWLDPATGRWLSVDPVESEPRYTYVANQPTTRVDPTGEAAWSAWYEGYIAGPGRRLAAAGEAQIELLGTTALVQALGIWGVDEKTSRPLISQIISFLKRLGGSLLHAVSDFVSKLRGWVAAAGQAVSAGWRSFVAALGKGLEKYRPPRDAGGVALWVLGIVCGIIKSAIARLPIVQVVSMIQAAFQLLSNISILQNLLGLLREIALGPFEQLFSVAKPPPPFQRGLGLADLILGILDFIKGIRRALTRLSRSRVPGQMAPAHAIHDGKPEDLTDPRVLRQVDQAAGDSHIRAEGRKEYNSQAKPRGAVVEAAQAASRGLWSLPWQERGRRIENLLGKNTIDNFPVVDRVSRVDGTYTSIKTIDLDVVSRTTLRDELSEAARHLRKFPPEDGLRWGGVVVEPSDVKRRVLLVAVPTGSMTPEQRDLFRTAIGEARRREHKVRKGADQDRAALVEIDVVEVGNDGQVCKLVP